MIPANVTHIFTMSSTLLHKNTIYYNKTNKYMSNFY